MALSTRTRKVCFGALLGDFVDDLIWRTGKMLMNLLSCGSVLFFLGFFTRMHLVVFLFPLLGKHSKIFERVRALMNAYILVVSGSVLYLLGPILCV